MLTPIATAHTIPIVLLATKISPLEIQAAFFFPLLALASVVDARARVIPDSLCALIALTGLIYFSPVKLFGILSALPLLIPAICKQGSIGGGDIKLTAASGLILGFAGGIAGLITGLAAMSLFFLLGKAINWPRKDKGGKANGTAALPMAPFLAIGFSTVYILLNFAGL